MAGERSFMELDTPDGFQALQDRFSFNRRARPPPHLNVSDDHSRVPLKQPSSIQRRESKGGLRSIFTRNKVEQAAVSPVLEEPPTSAISEAIMKAVTRSGAPRSMDLPRNNTPSTPAAPATPARPSTMSSRMNIRAKSQRSVKTGRPSPKSSKSSTKSSPRRPPRTSPAWDPPPLFQAYPQAIKHATLSASTLSADAILRLNNHKRTNSLREEIVRNGGVEGAVDGAGKKADKPKTKHRRQISGSLSKADWTQKIFVLVTSGYLLQYAGDGSFDRLPEKMLQLTRDSVAFASDVIPGKHWVLQISQAMDADGTPAADSRSLLSRLAFRGADYRRTATSLLLVLNSADDMDSWMAIVKREIEALGGKKQVSETGKAKIDDKVMELRAQPSHRYLVARDPDQFSNPASPQLPPSTSPPWVNEDQHNEVRQEPEATKPVQASSIRPSSGSPSMTNSITSQDGRQLENLRDSNRFSYMSSGQKTLITSQGSSPASSPTRNSAPSFDEAPKISTEVIRPRPNASAINERRRSMQTFHVPVLDPQPNPKSYRHSVYGGPTRATRSRSPAPPNFSVPTQPTKRHSTMERPMAESPPPAVISLPASPRDSKHYSIIKGVRKAPPRPLNISRPLSPVKDSVSPKQAPKQTPMIIRHRNSTFEILQKPKSAVIDAPLRSPGPHTPSSTRETARQGLGISTPLPLPTSPHPDQVEWQVPERSAARLRPPLLPAEQIPSDDSTITLTSNTTREIKRDVSNPLPTKANTKAKISRPISMQVPLQTPPTKQSTGRPSPHDTRTYPTMATPSRTWPSPLIPTNKTPNTSRTFPKASPASKSVLARPTSPLNRTSGSLVSLRPDIQRIKDQSSSKTLEYRRSMPLLNGPPPAPPPDCALPPLPPPGSVGVKSPVGVRGSIRV